MKIIYFSLGYSTHDHRFLKAISDGGHEVFFVQLEGNQRQVEDLPVPENVRQVKWKGGREPFRWSKLPGMVLDFKRLIHNIKPDLVHAGPIQTCTFIAALSGFRPILAMSWGFDLVRDANLNSWMRWVTRYTLKRSAFFTSDANVSRDKAVAFGMDSEKTVIFPWGTNIEHFIPKKAQSGKKNPINKNRKPKTINPKSITLFCSRSWESNYGVDVLAKAFVKVVNMNRDVNLILLGGGSQGAKIRQTLMNGGVMERVHFGGQVSQRDLPRWYHMADIYISPSHVDGSSVTLMEALACGLPCLVSDIPGNKEWVEDGGNGWLFRDGDVDDLVEKILNAIKSRRSFKRIGKSARKTAEQKADWSKNFGKLLEAYQATVKYK